jgi:hypothetical protein
MNLPLLGIPNAPSGVASGKPIKGSPCATDPAASAASAKLIEKIRFENFTTYYSSSSMFQPHPETLNG